MTSFALAINRQPGKLWAVLQFPVTRILIGTLAVLGADVVVQLCAHALHVVPGSLADVLAQIIIVAVVVVAYWLYVRIIERRKVSEFSMPGAAREAATGFATGVFLFSVTMLLMWALGAARFSFDGDWRALGFALLGAVAAGVAEEILVRGILFRIIEESLGSWIALLISAVVFGAMHAFNPGATLVSSPAIALEAGVLLAAVFMYTRRLWMAIGLHAAWNFTEGGIFGASVSGGRSHGLLESHFHGSAWLTGGQFGPEASLLAVVVCLAAALIFLRLAWKRQHFMQPAWKRSAQAA